MTEAPQGRAPLLDPVSPGLARLVLVDTRPERLGVMRALLSASGLVTLVGEASSATSAIETVEREGADVVIVEIQMPLEDGLATVAALRQRFPDVRIVVCSFHQVAASRREALDSGADAYLTKPLDLGELGDLLRQYSASKREPV